jgi:hypothetical protein
VSLIASEAYLCIDWDAIMKSEMKSNERLSGYELAYDVEFQPIETNLDKLNRCIAECYGSLVRIMSDYHIKKGIQVHARNDGLKGYEEPS